ncbi:formate dehydrogenase subunit gamma [Neotabrizicola sp. VNH66]|uniref:formate dehydrogenase subunit gamma n=1 Tax=Neotabrizicola sp. VNH66 TaxID=3400918 RepID=UPI003C1258A7
MLDTVDMLARVREILEDHRTTEGALLPILHDVQAAFGYIPEGALPVIAEALTISRAEAYGVMTFYHDFRERPAGRHVLKLCRAEACQAVGAEGIAAHACEKLGLDWHETGADGRVTLEPVFCLGLCASGPAAMVDGKLVARLDREKLDKIIEGLR